MRHARSLLALAVVLTASSSARADGEPGWHIAGELDVSSIVGEGAGLAIMLRPPTMPSLRIGVFGERKTAPFAGLSPANRGWKLTFPLVFEGVVEVSPSTKWPVLVGVRAGYSHFHADREALVGLAEEDWYGLTPYVGWRTELAYGLYLSTWAGWSLPIFVSSTQAEIDVAAADKTYNAVAAMPRVGVSLGFEL